MPAYYNYPGFEGAVMLGMEEYDKSNKLAAKMETQEINENFRHSISTVGYKFTKVNFGMGGKSGKKVTDSFSKVFPADSADFRRI